MTKILHVPTGQFLYLVSSFRYDRLHNFSDGAKCRVLNVEESFMFEDEKKTRDRILDDIISGRDGFVKSNSFLFEELKFSVCLNCQLTKEEF